MPKVFLEKYLFLVLFSLITAIFRGNWLVKFLPKFETLGPSFFP